MEKRTMRRSQVIMGAGPGAILDMLGESFVGEDISQWRGRFDAITAPRIAAYFGVEELRSPISAEDKGPGLPYFRFPQWLFCGVCRDMTKWNPRREKQGQSPRCEQCSSRSQLVPMRFVMVCGNGHLADVDWVRWAHSKKSTRDQAQCGQPRLRFIHLYGVGGGLDSLEVRCSTCEAGRDLHDLTAPEAMKRIGVSCRGRQPWQGSTETTRCDQSPIVVQRGASSVYFARVESAIDIPPDSNWVHLGGPIARIKNNSFFKSLLSDPETDLKEPMISRIALKEDVTEQAVRDLLADQLGTSAQVFSNGTPAELRSREWQALISPTPEHDPRDAFLSRRVPFPSPAGHHGLNAFAGRLGNIVSDVILVDRLREVRVLRGFYRHTMNRMVEPDLGLRTGVLPAIEVFGEGVFIRFNESVLRDWERLVPVRERVDPLRIRLANSHLDKWILDKVAPRLVLIHTLGHLLMRQMSFDAGYSSSSLRERIFADDDPGSPFAGLLIYTAAGDSEGSLGGLARLGEPQRLVPTFARTLAAAEWCSLDPVCMESEAQGTDNLSLAACHACALAPETSCVLGNVLLDRMLLIDHEFGFFYSAVTELLSAQSESLT